MKLLNKLIIALFIVTMLNQTYVFNQIHQIEARKATNKVTKRHDNKQVAERVQTTFHANGNTNKVTTTRYTASGNIRWQRVDTHYGNGRLRRRRRTYSDYKQVNGSRIWTKSDDTRYINRQGSNNSRRASRVITNRTSTRNTTSQTVYTFNENGQLQGVGASREQARFTNNVITSTRRSTYNNNGKINTRRWINVASCNQNNKRPTTIKNIILVNKDNPLPCNYNPGENRQARSALNNLMAEMRKENLNVGNSISAYRTYSQQTTLFQNYVRKNGFHKALTYSARPGYSEHQTGLGFDLTHRNGKLLGNNQTSRWLANNAHRYGFIIRYPEGKEHITGYTYEPWHVRYVGVNVATEIFEQRLTLEEYLAL